MKTTLSKFFLNVFKFGDILTSLGRKFHSLAPLNMKVFLMYSDFG